MNRPPRKTDPPHGHIFGFYAVIFDSHLGRKIIVPISRADLLRGKVRLP